MNLPNQKILNVVKNRRGMSTLLPVIAIGLIITASFGVVQGVFLRRTKNFLQQAQSNKLVNVMETLGKNVVLDGYELANREAYRWFNSVLGTGACTMTTPWECCRLVNFMGLNGANHLHLRMSAAGKFGCWPNASLAGTPSSPALDTFCDNDPPRTADARPIGAVDAGANEENTWGCFFGTDGFDKACFDEPGTTTRFCALFKPSAVAMMELGREPSFYETMVASVMDYVDQSIDRNFEIPETSFFMSRAHAYASRPIATGLNGAPDPWGEDTMALLPSVGPALGTPPNGVGRHLVQRCYTGDQCSEYWMCIRDPAAPGSPMSPNIDTENTFCFRQSLHLSATRQVAAAPTAGATGNAICVGLDEDRSAGQSAGDQYFTCVKTTWGDCTAASPAAPATGHFAFCEKTFQWIGNTGSANGARTSL